MRPKVSVIVPVYKVENFIDRCVQSILSQTYTDYELILVDDGSGPDYADIFEEAGVSVAIVYGNHDADRNCMTKEEQWEVYESYSCFVGKRDSEELSGFGTYYLPILSSKSDKQKFVGFFGSMSHF